LNLRDRATYGVDWLVVHSSSAADALRQWERYKEGRHVHQGTLEAEAARYRTGAGPDYLPYWKAEPEVVAQEVEATIEVIDDEQRALAGEKRALQACHAELTRSAKRRKPRRVAREGRRRAA
jgi:hypothetical protein